MQDAPVLTVQQTLSIIKPDAVASNHVGAICHALEQGGLKIIAARMTHLSRERAQEFYAVHAERPFYNDLVTFMCSGPILAMVLEGDNAVTNYRTLMGATDPKKAAPGTIRASFGSSIDNNAVHGSDSSENAENEIRFFFAADQVHTR